MTEQIKNSVGAITASRELKDTILENIFTKAENATTPKKNKVLRFVSYATAAAIALGVFGLYNSINNTPNTVMSANEETIDMKNSLAASDIMGYDYFTEISLANSISSEITLLSYELDGTTLNLYFNEELQNEVTNTASDELIQIIASAYFSYISDIENINIYSNDSLITLDGVEMNSEYINSIVE